MKPSLISQLESILQNADQFDEKQLFFSLKKIVQKTEDSYYTPTETPAVATILDDYINKKLLSTGNSLPKFQTSLDCIDLNPDIRFAPGEFIVIAGRPAMGKTQLLVQFAACMSQSIPVLYHSFDLNAEGLVNRLLRFFTELSGNIIQNANEYPEKIKEIVHAIDKIKNLQLTINENAALHLHHFIEYSKRQIETNGVQVILIDYLQLMGGINHRYREQEIGFITRELKKLAREHNVCIIVSSQLSRAVENRAGDKRPILSDLRESGSIEQEADKVFVIYRPEYYGFIEDNSGNSTKSMVDLMLLKNRNGPCCELKVKIDENFTRFRDMDSQEKIDKIEISLISKRLHELDNENSPF